MKTTAIQYHGQLLVISKMHEMEKALFERLRDQIKQAVGRGDHENDLYELRVRRRDKKQYCDSDWCQGCPAGDPDCVGNELVNEHYPLDAIFRFPCGGKVTIHFEEYDGGRLFYSYRALEHLDDDIARFARMISEAASPPPAEPSADLSE